VTVNLPGRPLISASLFLPNGAVDEPAGEGGATVLAARALTEGTLRRDAVALTEAAERLGASLHAEAGWDATVAGVEVPAERLGAALALLAELVREPAFPQREVERLRDQRLNDLLQAKVDPARRAEEAFIETIYAPGTPYARVAGGRRETVATLDAVTLRRAFERWSSRCSATWRRPARVPRSRSRCPSWRTAWSVPGFAWCTGRAQSSRSSGWGTWECLGRPRTITPSR
jgi:predicted Zn-dependent peptidase